MFKYPMVFILIFIVSCTPRQPEQAAQSSSTEDIPNVTNETPEPVPEKKKKEPLASADSQAQQKSSAVAVSGKPKINGDSLNSIQPADSPSVPDENGTIYDLRQAVQANNKDEVEKLLKLSDVKSHINDLIVTPARQSWISYVPEERQSLFFKAVKNNTNIKVTHYHNVVISLSEEEQNLVDSIKDRARMRKTVDSLVKSKMDPHTAKQQANSLEILDLLLEAGADPLIPNEKGETPLEHAAQFDTVILQKLLKIPAVKISIKNNSNKGRRAFLQTIHSSLEYPERMDMFLKAGADLLRSDEKGNTPPPHGYSSAIFR